MTITSSDRPMVVHRYSSSRGMVAREWADGWEAIVFPNGYGLWLVEFGHGRSWRRTDYVERTPLLLWWAKVRDHAPAHVQDWIAHEVPFLGADYDPAVPGSRLVDVTVNCEIIRYPATAAESGHAFYAVCRHCPYVTLVSQSRAAVRRWANRHDEDQPNDGRAR